jgi:hypothetical protein
LTFDSFPKSPCSSRGWSVEVTLKVGQLLQGALENLDGSFEK